MDERRNTRGPLSDFARRVLSDHYAVDLSPGSLSGIAKLFDFVSPDRRVVGDANISVCSAASVCQRRNSQ
jgi:hypothetical protein